MDELAFERRSTFDALYLARLTPLLFETEPRGPDEKVMIDQLVDRSTLFVGIYYQSIGWRSRDLFDLEPITYELYRFLLRYSDPVIGAETGFRNHINSRIRERLDALLEPSPGQPFSEAVLQLRERVRNGDAMLSDLLRDRVRLFIKTHGYDTQMSVRLAQLLRPFPLIEFASRGDEIAIRSSIKIHDDEESPPKRYVTARLDLLERMLAMVTKAARDGGLKETSTDDEDQPRYKWRIVAKDEAGVLWMVLRTLFNEGMNIDFICSGKPKVPEADKGDRVVIDVVVRRFLGKDGADGPPADDESLPAKVERVKARLKERLDDEQAGRTEVYFEVLGSWPDWGHVPNARKDRSSLYYSVGTADVPGQALRLVEKVFYHGGTVDLLFLDSRSKRLSRKSGTGAQVNFKLVAISEALPEEGSADRKSSFDAEHRTRFEAELGQGLGVVSVEPLTHKRFFGLWKKVRKEAKQRAKRLEQPTELLSVDPGA